MEIQTTIVYLNLSGWLKKVSHISAHTYAYLYGVVRFGTATIFTRYAEHLFLPTPLRLEPKQSSFLTCPSKTKLVP